jgi:hypothetical protein
MKFEAGVHSKIVKVGKSYELRTVEVKPASKSKGPCYVFKATFRRKNLGPQSEYEQENWFDH